MKYLKVKDWEQFQHYKDRNPPWIKLSRDLLRDYNFQCLQDASKLQLMLIWLLASQMDNKIPADEEFIKNQIGVKGEFCLKELIDKGYLVDDSGMLAGCKQSAMLETETEAYSKEADNKNIDVADLYTALAEQQKPKRTTAPEIELPYTTLPDEWKDFCKLEMKWSKEQAYSAFTNFRDYWTSPARGLKNKKKDWFMTFKTTSRSGITKPNANIVQLKNSGRVDGMAMMREYLHGK